MRGEEQVQGEGGGCRVDGGIEGVWSGVWRALRIERAEAAEDQDGKLQPPVGVLRWFVRLPWRRAVHFHSTPPNATRHDMNNCFFHAEHNRQIARFSRLRSFMSYKTFLQTAGRRGITRMPNPLYTFKNDSPFYCVYLAVSFTANENGLLPISGLRGSMGEAKSPSSLSSSSAAITSRC
jgi:hypothetical protein